MREPSRPMFPLIRHQRSAPCTEPPLALASLSPRRQSQGATKSPRHMPRLAARAENSSATYAREYRREARLARERAALDRDERRARRRQWWRGLAAGIRAWSVTTVRRVRGETKALRRGWEQLRVREERLVGSEERDREARRNLRCEERVRNLENQKAAAEKLAATGTRDLEEARKHRAVAEAMYAASNGRQMLDSASKWVTRHVSQHTSAEMFVELDPEVPLTVTRQTPKFNQRRRRRSSCLIAMSIRGADRAVCGAALSRALRVRVRSRHRSQCSRASGNVRVSRAGPCRFRKASRRARHEICKRHNRDPARRRLGDSAESNRRGRGACVPIMARRVTCEPRHGGEVVNLKGIGIWKRYVAHWCN